MIVCYHPKWLNSLVYHFSHDQVPKSSTCAFEVREGRRLVNDKKGTLNLTYPAKLTFIVV